MVDKAARGKGGQDPRDRTDVDAGAAGDLVGPQFCPRLRKLVDYRDRPLDSCDLTGGWLTGSCQGTIILTSEILLPLRQ
jgi:hypothetical protein